MSLDTNTRNNLLFQLGEILPEEYLLTSEEAIKPYECDGLSAYQKLPVAVVLPETIEQVQRITKICSQLKVPIVARGAGTGLSGGALPHEGGIILGLSRFNKIEKIDTDNLTATVQPGVRNLAITEAARPFGLYYAPDPSSQIACSIGGNVAENAGGVHCLKYGLTVHNVQQVTIVTVDGELVTLGSQTLDTPGYDLLALITGSEGMLGIIVEIVVKLLPKPHAVKVLMASFKKVEDAGNAVANIIAEGVIPAGLEMMDKPAIHAAEAFAKANYPLDAEAILLCELDGSEQQLAEQIETVSETLRNANADDIVIADSADEQARLWAGRKSAFPAVGRISPDYYCMDGTIPRKQIAYVLKRISELSEECGLRVANVFHAGDGNLHPLILYDANKEGELEKTEKFGADILTLCVEVGGTITGEHGVGHEKIDQMCVQFSPEELTQFFAVKNAFDPDALLNPGKAVPTLHRCAELGGMHVHNGQLPHPEIPRF
ncbi:glycolate oxidase subunit GlcD [Cocleimonas flava]|uniref:Glycolate oxidase n=1 Tax=Cocleimonas flava TaxID=634765 RepID=A0A4R1EWZ1_9GAMM|nr:MULTISPECIES: FAD-linked oxidase C-terminal domain-containing protein [Cocleimonas]MEB8433673.1 FAD-binding protein [Cocleimonas sp. KMM 6892]MEC4716484.1 FAD-binding protein [Cocleimonas sp. KMM 6895]MEC4745623.1 FAD-binding protein [Cocleimonas sp. KMM 6896]TCJ85320.1 glycolate oxidase [Cocleimonas flava]